MFKLTQGGSAQGLVSPTVYNVRDFISGDATSLRTSVAVGAHIPSPLRTFLSRATQHPLRFALEAVEQSFEARSNPLDLYLYMLDNDDMIPAAINMKAGVISSVYKGVGINADGSMSSREEKTLEFGENWGTKLKIRTKIFQIAKHLLTFGNSVYRTDLTLQGYPDLFHLPLNYITILEHPRQLTLMGYGRDASVWTPNYYVFNEQLNPILTPDGQPVVYPAEEILHFQLNPGHDQMDDYMGRWTYGVWSKSPLKPIISTWWWKQELYWTHMLALEQTLPKRHHMIDLEWINEESARKPGTYTKTQIEWEIQLKRAYIDAYRLELTAANPDEDWITDAMVKIENKESKAITFLKPNELISQIDAKHVISMGIPPSVLGISQSSSFAAEVINASYSNVSTDWLVDCIFPQLEVMLKAVMMDQAPWFSKQIKGIKLIKGLPLDKDQDVMAKRAAVLSELNIFHPDELREISGATNILSPKMKKEMKAHYKWKAELGKPTGPAAGAQSSTKNAAANKNRGNPAQAKRPATNPSKAQQQRTN